MYRDVWCMYAMQFKLWSTIDERLVCRFTSDAKDKPLRELKLLQWNLSNPDTLGAEESVLISEVS